jgi:glycerol 2-dehydrogenase (NADP+)
MAACDTRFKLNTGAEIPALGLGTWQSQPGEVARAVSHAIKVGYRHIDAALCYGNENEVGQGIKEAIDAGIVKREDLFVTTKLWCSYHARVEEGLEQSLKDLGLEYVDLYLMHWPLAMNHKGECGFFIPRKFETLTNCPTGNHNIFPKLADGSRDILHNHSHVTTWKSMEKLVGTGKVRAIGVSNYSVKFLEELLPQATIVPAANQIENHPLLPQQEIVDFCIKAGIHITAYSPLGSTGSPLFTAEPIVAVANKRGVTPATVLLSWHSKYSTNLHSNSNFLC